MGGALLCFGEAAARHPPPACQLANCTRGHLHMAHAFPKLKRDLKPHLRPKPPNGNRRMAFSDRRSGSNTAAGAFGCATSYELKTGLPGGVTSAIARRDQAVRGVWRVPGELA